MYDLHAQQDQPVAAQLSQVLAPQRRARGSSAYGVPSESRKTVGWAFKICCLRRGPSWASGEGAGPSSARSSTDGTLGRSLRAKSSTTVGATTDNKRAPHGGAGGKVVHINVMAGTLRSAAVGSAFEVEAVRWPVAQAPPQQQPQHVGWLSRFFASRCVSL